MKKINIKLLSLLVVVAISLTSCLNDLEDFLGDFGSSPAIAELSEAPDASTGTTFYYVTYTTTPVDVPLVRVNIASANTLKSQTKITLALDDALITAYNTAKGLTDPATMFYPVPMAAMTIASYDVTIPAGEREANWVIKINPSLIPDLFSKKYLIGVKIASADNGLVVSGNYGTKLVRVMAKNKYHGTYKVTGYFVHPSSPRALNLTKDFLSVGPNTISGGYADLGGAGYKYNPITVDESGTITIPGVSKPCYRVILVADPPSFLPTNTNWFVYNTGTIPPDGTEVKDFNYCYEHTPGKWTFVLFSGYSNETRKSYEVMVMQ